MEIYKTSDTPFAALLLTLGFKCVTKGVNSNNDRVWFGFEDTSELIAGAEIGDFYSDWIGETENWILDVKDIPAMTRIRACLVRVTKGVENDLRFTPKQWNEYYKA
jgi:hypothetical protein